MTTEEFAQHQNAWPWLGAFVDGQVDRDRQAAIEQHLRNCPLCQEEVAGLRKLSSLLVAQPVPAALSQVSLWPDLGPQLVARRAANPRQGSVGWLDWLPPAGLLLAQILLHGVALAGLVLSAAIVFFGLQPLAWLPLERATAGMASIADSLRLLPVRPITGLLPDLPVGVDQMLGLVLPTVLWLFLSGIVTMLYLSWLLAWCRRRCAV